MLVAHGPHEMLQWLGQDGDLTLPLPLGQDNLVLLHLRLQVLEGGAVVGRKELALFVAQRALQMVLELFGWPLGGLRVRPAALLEEAPEALEAVAGPATGQVGELACSGRSFVRPLAIVRLFFQQQLLSSLSAVCGGYEAGKGSGTAAFCGSRYRYHLWTLTLG